MEIYYEKNIVNKSIDKHKKRNIVFSSVRILAIIVLVIEIFLILSFQEIPVGKGAGAVVMSFFISLLIISPPILAIIIFSRLIAKLNSEYDYYISGENFRIIHVINRKKRKKFLEIPINAVSAVGLIESENFDRFDIDKSVKKINAFCNDDAVLGYFYYTIEGDKKLLVLEFDNELLINLKKALPISVFDDSVKSVLLKAVKEK
ncbi:MAG: hypothetical protein ACLSUT_01015 [Christensenellales bacterium]